MLGLIKTLRAKVGMKTRNGYSPHGPPLFLLLGVSFLPLMTWWLCAGRRETSSTGPTKFEVQLVAQFDNHNSQVWRVSWNITSTLLASSGDDGCVRLWKGEEAPGRGRACRLSAHLTPPNASSYKNLQNVCMLWFIYMRWLAKQIQMTNSTTTIQIYFEITFTMN